jgi:acetoin utilization deacetylase AcuC-like enzyme
MGFDTALGDVGNTRPGGTEPGMDLEVRDFEWATVEIMKIADLCCGGRVVSVLEGGYGSVATLTPHPIHKARTRSADSHQHSTPVSV